MNIGSPGNVFALSSFAGLVLLIVVAFVVRPPDASVMIPQTRAVYGSIAIFLFGLLGGYIGARLAQRTDERL